MFLAPHSTSLRSHASRAIVLKCVSRWLATGLVLLPRRKPIKTFRKLYRLTHSGPYTLVLGKHSPKFTIEYGKDRFVIEKGNILG